MEAHFSSAMRTVTDNLSPRGLGKGERKNHNNSLNEAAILLKAQGKFPSPRNEPTILLKTGKLAREAAI